MRRLLLFAVPLVLALLIPASAMATVVTATESRYGKVLFDGDGRVLYLFTKEKTDKPRCYGPCAKAWPPFVVGGTPDAEGATKQKLFGTTKRRNGNIQGTYNGHPLYYYEHDDPGEILCHDVFEYGGDWFVVTPKGKAAD